MPSQSPIITYQRLTNDHWEDVVKLFSSSRECGLCFCMNHRVPPAKEVLGEDAKKALKETMNAGRVQSILAYAGDACVGWCAVDPLSEQPGHDYCHWTGAKKDANIWSIHCLYIHPDFRGHGISGGLIKAATHLARDMGAGEVLAFPIPETMRGHFPTHDGEFSGRQSTFEKLGFTKDARINDFYQVMSLKTPATGKNC